MAESKIPGRLQFIESMLSLWSWIQAHWQWVAAIMTGGLFVWLAAVADWLDQYGVIAWASAGLLAAFIFGLICAVFARFRLWLAQARYTAAKSKTADTLNALDDTFTKLRVRLSDLDPPMLLPLKGKTFIDCEVLGPGVMLMDRCVMNEVKFYATDLIAVPESGPPINNCVIFERGTFKETTFFNITLLVPEKHISYYEGLGAKVVVCRGDAKP